jgi:hypothetical protein
MQKCLHSNWLQNNEAFSKAPKQQQKVLERWKNRKKKYIKQKQKPQDKHNHSDRTLV